jgi:hypothetical protein
MYGPVAHQVHETITDIQSPERKGDWPRRCVGDPVDEATTEA